MFGDQTPIREDLLARVYPLLERHRGKLVVLGYDVQLQNRVVNPGTPNATMTNAWCLVVCTVGGLLGPTNYLSYVWTFGDNPQVPLDTELEEAVKETFKRLSLMQVRQVQLAKPGNATSN